jgi:hypothetical protein
MAEKPLRLYRFVRRCGKRLARRGERHLLVEQALDLGVNALAGGATVPGAGGKERLRLVGRRGFNAPFFEPRHQHPGMKQTGLLSRDHLLSVVRFGSYSGFRRGCGAHDVYLANHR